MKAVGAVETIGVATSGVIRSRPADAASVIVVPATLKVCAYESDVDGAE